MRDQTGDPGSMLELYRALIALRAELDGDVALLEAADGVVAFRRGRHTRGREHLRRSRAVCPPRAPWLLSTHPGRRRRLRPSAAHEGRVVG